MSTSARVIADHYADALVTTPFSFGIFTSAAGAKIAWWLDPLGANLLLAQCVRYDLGNMFDPAYTMVCKVPREFLPSEGPSGD